MIKEINEQPEALRRTILPRVVEGMPYLEADGINDELLKNLKSLRVVACGTAMHAGIVGKTMIESLARVPVTVEIASEFRYCDPILNPEEPIICVSQSGETADTMAALRMAKEQKIPTIGIVNVKGSALSREADAVMYTHAGPEIAVASTKAYTVQLAAFALIAIRLAYVRGILTEEETRKMTACLAEDVPEKLAKTLEDNEGCKRFSEHLKWQQHAFFLGRGVDYTLSMEASLKLKEISYIHSEAYAAGELKHGTISLITDGTPVIVTASDPRLFEKTVGSLREAASRGGKILLLASPALGDVESAVDTIILPDLPTFFAPFASISFLQRIAYYTAVLMDCDVDQPRNLAKSVTVE
ncbi:MAG: isomerizing glutamine--fructose-6-phosphate transaminase, partial [Clostridia bacterium]|nr:isomerizing glutamine--fructose-6-phosphate transaminase [Clostridia bacterium]